MTARALGDSRRESKPSTIKTFPVMRLCASRFFFSLRERRYQQPPGHGVSYPSIMILVLQQQLMVGRVRACAGSRGARTATAGAASAAHGRVLNRTLGTNGADEAKGRVPLPGISPASSFTKVFNKASIFLSSSRPLGTFSTMALPTPPLRTLQIAAPSPRTSTSGFRR